MCACFELIFGLHAVYSYIEELVVVVLYVAYSHVGSYIWAEHFLHMNERLYNKLLQKEVNLYYT